MAAAKRPRTKTNAAHKGAVGNQPRSTQTSRLVPEFKKVVAYKLEQSEVAQIKSVQAVNKGWTDAPVQLRSGIIAPGSRIL